jgi:hypothetical protein
MMRRAKGPRREKAVFPIDESRDAVNFRRLDCLTFRHGRKNRGETLGQHGFTCAWTPEHQHVMPAGHGYLKSAFRMSLPSDLVEVDGIILFGLEEGFAVELLWRNILFPP